MTVTTDSPTDAYTNAYTELRDEIREAAREIHRLPGNASEEHIEHTTDELMSLLSAAWFMGNRFSESGAKNPFNRYSA